MSSIDKITSKTTDDYKARVTQSVVNGTPVVLPQGKMTVWCGANTTLEFNTTGSTWVAVGAAAGHHAFVFSNGAQWRLNNSGATVDSFYSIIK